MHRVYLSVCFLLCVWSTHAQLYVLQNQRQDSLAFDCILHQELPVLCDTFYKALCTQNSLNIKPFIPDIRFLKAMYDSLEINVRRDQILFRQQTIQRSLLRDYRRILKSAEKWNISLSRMVLKDTEFEYGLDENNHRFCFVTQTCAKRKQRYEISFIAIMLNKHWFVGENLKFEKK